MQFCWITKTSPLFSSAENLRLAVFSSEQGFSSLLEFDELDSVSFHLLLYYQQIPVGTLRYYAENEHTAHIGRVCVLLEHRSKGFGKELLQLAEIHAKEQGFKRAVLGAQYDKRNFYIKNGYTEFGKIYLDENCPHIYMEKEL